MPDKRTDMQKAAWNLIGPPLYYCNDCLLAVSVKPVPGAEPEIKRPCEGCTCEIVAPRKAIAAGVGGLSLKNRVRVNWWQIKAAITGRCA